MKNFRTYTVAIEFYKLAQTVTLSSHLKDQFLRAASSIALNLAEGSGRKTVADQRRFFNIALGSARECEAVLDLADSQVVEAKNKLNFVAASIYCLIKNCRGWE